MRMIGLVLAVAAIGWMFFQASGSDEGSGAIPEPYQQSLEKAESVEQSLQDAADQRLKTLDEREP